VARRRLSARNRFPLLLAPGPRAVPGHRLLPARSGEEENGRGCTLLDSGFALPGSPHPHRGPRLGLPRGARHAAQEPGSPGVRGDLGREGPGRSDHPTPRPLDLRPENAGNGRLRPGGGDPLASGSIGRTNAGDRPLGSVGEPSRASGAELGISGLSAETSQRERASLGRPRARRARSQLGGLTWPVGLECRRRDPLSYRGRTARTASTVPPRHPYTRRPRDSPSSIHSKRPTPFIEN
jgi:hypothetical protein